MVKLRNRKGFTLLEVLTAIAVVAIISGPLLYTFVTSTKVGRHSYDSDKANALSVELVETVKAAAGDFGGYAYSYTYSEGKYWHNYEKTSYYGADWTPNVPQSEAIYRAALTVKGEDTGSGVYMSYVPELVDTAGNSYRIEVDYTLLSTGDCGITMDSLPGDLYRVSASAGILVDTRDGLHKPAVEFPAGDLKTGIVPVIIDLGETPGAEVHFLVHNRTGKEFGLYVYGDYEAPHHITLEPTSGAVSVSYMQVSAATLDYDVMEVKVQVARLDNGSQLADYTSLVYLPA